MAAQVDMALDLSAKPVSHCGVTLDKAPSPCPSMSSDLDTSVDRPSSAFSDKDSDRSFPSSFTGYTKGMGVKPVSGPVPMGVHLPGDQTEDRLSPTDSLTGSKPFKMYPFDSMPNVFSQLASNAASMTAAGLYSPYAGAGTPSLGGMLDGPLSLSSPITQYIQQKKRRSESRLNSQMKVETPNGMSSPSDITSTSALSPSASMHGGFTPNSPSAYSADDGSDGYNGSASKRQKTEMTLDDRREMSYRDRRVKNNEAAKRSRDARRMKEEEIALRAAFLEQENLKLRAQVTILKNETTKLHYMLYNRM